MYQIETKTFSGPFDLLLQLIHEHELDIAEISLAQIADQFVSYISKLEEKNMDELADFLVVAAELLYLKSRALLPLPPEEEEPSELKEQLALYERFWERSGWIKENWQKTPLFTRPFSRIIRHTLMPPKSIKSGALRNAFVEVVKRLNQSLIILPKKIFERGVSVDERIAHLKELLSRAAKLEFSHFITNCERNIIIASFLALLELIKQRQCSAHQQELFAEITLEKIK